MRYSLPILFFCLLQSAFAQNLVPNPSFEEYTSCPTGSSQIYKATGWDTHLFSEELYHSCALFYTIPQNPFGNQCPVTGIGYSGIVSYNPLGALQESFGRQLSNPMEIGQKYFVNMKVSLAEWSGSASDKIGILFSTIPYNDTNPPPVNNFANIYTSSIISDTIGWTDISGSFIADSAYNYISIGTFFDDFNIDTLIFDNTAQGITYYFIDDICVSTDSLVCIDITPQIVGFSADITNLIEGGCINFNVNTDVDYYSYKWQFNGGQPNVSFDSLPPSICYDSSGVYSVTLIASDSSGCADTIIKDNYITVDSATAINENMLNESFMVYPNPIRDRLIFMPSNNIIEVAIYNLLGELIYYTDEKVNEIDFSTKPEGIYVLNIKTEKNNISRKIIKISNS